MVGDENKCEGDPQGDPQNGGALRPMTFGEKAVGLSFNPSGDEKVDEVKRLYAAIIDLCNEIRSDAGQGEKGRLMSLAITEAQAA